MDEKSFRQSTTCKYSIHHPEYALWGACGEVFSVASEILWVKQILSIIGALMN